MVLVKIVIVQEMMEVLSETQGQALAQAHVSGPIGYFRILWLV